jgi:hypothetical protein
MELWWSDPDREKLKCSEKTCPITALFTAYTAHAGLGTNPDLAGKGSATDCLRHGTTQSFCNTFVQKSLVSVSL